MGDGGADSTGRDITDLDALEAARLAYAACDWAEAWQAFRRADAQQPLSPDDREQLALTAYFLARDADFVTQLERAHNDFLSADQSTRAARSAFWIGLTLMMNGQVGPAMGWFGRARRILEHHATACVEEGYLLLPLVEKHLASDELDQAYDVAARALVIGEQFADADLVAAARHMTGRVRLVQARIDDGLALLDETMASVLAGDTSERLTGMLYCSVIHACQQVHEYRRAREWTDALTRWCRTQPSLVAFTGSCLIHRAELLNMNGDWDQALTEAVRAAERFEIANDQRSRGAAIYQQGEIQRLRGEFDQAEATFAEAARLGYDPQPGMALLRLACGRFDQATAAIQRVLDTTSLPLQRVPLLVAAVEISIAAGDSDRAERFGVELEQIADRFPTEALKALADAARAALQLDQGDARGALVPLQRACEIWRRISSPLAQARVLMLTGRARRALEDHDGAEHALSAARHILERLGAHADLRRLDANTKLAASNSGLTARELEVLRLVATGTTNKAIAQRLGLSTKTIDRHLSNIFVKLGVASRAEATAYAFRNQLV